MAKTLSNPSKFLEVVTYTGNGGGLIIGNNYASNPSPSYDVARSLRFNGTGTLYLNRTFSAPTSQNVFTFSCWIKLAGISTARTLLGVGTNSSLRISATDAIVIEHAGVVQGTSTELFKDSSQWYNLVYVQNGTAYTIYMNNDVKVSGTFTNTNFNTAAAHQIGAVNAGALFSGYMAEVHFVDGQALTPSSFGELDTEYDQWVPKAYAGTYGNNGFKLTFSNNSSVSNLGLDSSGGAKNWTVNAGFSVTTDTDSVVDTPTNNFMTANPLSVIASNSTISKGNLTTDSGTTGLMAKPGLWTIPRSGKWYWEVTLIAGSEWICGIIPEDALTDGTIGLGGGMVEGYAGGYSSGSALRYHRGISVAYGSSLAINDVVGVAFDADIGTLELFKNGVSQGIAFSNVNLSKSYYPACSDNSTGGTSTFKYNFGQQGFVYTAPTGFKALSSKNLPKMTDSFFVDIAIFKNRSSAQNWSWTDTLRGPTKTMASEGNVADVTEFNTVKKFSRGMVLGSDVKVNTVSQQYYALLFRGSEPSFTISALDAAYGSPTIGSTVKRNLRAGYSLFTYTGNGVAATVSHGLGVKPAMIIIKNTTTSVNGNWRVWHKNLTGETYYLGLNQTTAQATASTVFNGITSNVINVGTDASTNENGVGYVGYAFFDIPGFSKFGTYSGNGSTDGPFVHLGFEPAVILFKRFDSTSDWHIRYLSPTISNSVTSVMAVNLANAESSYSTTSFIDVIHNGFKLRQDGTSGYHNASGGNYIYAAFAEAPNGSKLQLPQAGK